MKKTLIFLPALLMQTGTYSLADLRANGAYGNQLLAEFGIPNALAVTNALTARYNQTLTASMQALAQTTTRRFESAPVAGGIRMERVSEYTNVRTQKGGTTAGRGLPLHAWDAATGWTEHFEAITTVGAFVQMLEGVQQASDAAIRSEITAAVYDPLERDIEEDLIEVNGIRRELIEGVKVKPFHNGDDEVPAVSPTGKKFAAGHNHYLASGGLTNEAIDATVQTVAEHSTGNNIVLNINEADVASAMGLSGFIPAGIQGVTMATNQNVANFTLDLSRTDSRNIGYTKGGILVRTRPWALPGYAVAENLNGARPLFQRVPEQAVFRGLRLRGQEGNTILRARTWEHQFGFGVGNRGGMAILNFGPKPNGVSATTYVRPPVLDDE